jgi:predicted transcriptional regulator
LELVAARVLREELEKLLEAMQVLEKLVEEEPLEVQVP